MSMWLLMNDGARNARLNERRNVCAASGLHHERRPRREHRVVDRRELVDAAADDPAEVIAEEDLVLDVGAALVAVVAVRGQRDVERVVAEVAAEGQRVLRADRPCTSPASTSNVLVSKTSGSGWPIRARAPGGWWRRRPAGW